MTQNELYQSLEACPIIASVQDEQIPEATASPVEVIFLLGGSLLTVKERIQAVHEAGKSIFIHIDLTEGVGKDKTGIEFLSACGADGIISTRAALIKFAKDCGMATVQRFFALDTLGTESIHATLHSSTPDLIELMPGVIGKIIERFSGGPIPIIAGGLIETKAEVTAALNYGALAVSTRKKELWYL